MKYAALGKSIPKRPSSWDNEQTPILERGSTLSSELCRVELGEAGEGAGLVPPRQQPTLTPAEPSAWSCWRCSDWGAWVLHARGTAGERGSQPPLNKSSVQSEDKLHPLGDQGAYLSVFAHCPPNSGQQSPFSRSVLSAASMSRASPPHLPWTTHLARPAPPTTEAHSPPAGVSVQTTTCLLRPLWTVT